MLRSLKSFLTIGRVSQLLSKEKGGGGVWVDGRREERGGTVGWGGVGRWSVGGRGRRERNGRGEVR